MVDLASMAPRPALPNLTTVRLFAALYVFGFHFIPKSIFGLGLTGVNLFFVLSGFILAYNYPTVPSWRKFYVSRFARIYPLYLVALILSLPSFIHTTVLLKPSDIWAIPLSLVMMQTWWPPVRSALNSAAWTLSVETFFYLCFPVLVPWAARRVHQWKLWIVVCCVLLVLPTSLYCFVLRPHFPAYSQFIEQLLTVPIFHLCEFIAGIFLGIHYLEKRSSFTGWQVTLAFLLLVVSIGAAQQISWYYHVLFDDGLLTLPYGILIYTLAGWRSRWFARPWLQLGGEISYGIYLLQFPVLNILRIGMRRPFPPTALVALCTLSAAYLGYIFIEKPIRIWILSCFGYKSHPKPIQTPGLQV